MDALDALIRSEALPASYRRTAQAIFRPIAERLRQTRLRLGRPVVFGLCGAQGSGKSTMAAALRILLEAEGLTAAVLALDDLYLPRSARERLAREVHPLLITRGPPGTHDVGLGLALIDVLTQGHAEVSLPRFDKALDDRAPGDAWPRVASPVDVILFEGWCVGARPQAEAALAAPVNALERDEDPDGRWRRYVNGQLEGDYAALFARIDLLALLQAPGFEAVYDWRALQEQKLAERVRREGRKDVRIMGPDALRRFLLHYQRLTEWILEEMPARADILLPVDQDQRVADLRFSRRAAP
jgi:D-glycerate 3-kinase